MAAQVQAECNPGQNQLLLELLEQPRCILCGSIDTQGICVYYDANILLGGRCCESCGNTGCNTNGNPLESFSFQRFQRIR